MEWEELYAATVAETRSEELQILIAETRRSLTIRLSELSQETDTIPERLKIDEAFSALKLWANEPAV